MEGGVQNSWKGLKYFCGVLTCKIFEMVDVLNFLIRKWRGGGSAQKFGLMKKGVLICGKC